MNANVCIARRRQVMQEGPSSMHTSREKVSAFVISFNRAPIIGTCLRALRFADEVIVVDKSSTDATPAIAALHADRVITVPWSPTVEHTRAFAVTQCTHDWIVFADDDECFSPQAVKFIQAELAAPRADIYSLPRRDYILGTHDERAYYWPEHHIRLFRRGTVEFSATVHAGIVLCSDRTLVVAADTGACIHHLSHPDVAQWIEKANRYTSCIDRARVDDVGTDLIGFAHARIDHWIGRTPDTTPAGYPAAVALLRATYDLIDRLKVWEEERGLDGDSLFRQVCADLDAAHADMPPAADGGMPPARAGERTSATPPVEARPSAEATLRASLRDLHAHHEVQQSRHAQELADARAALRAVENSKFWRATAWARSVTGRLRTQR
jgi:Glycosyl transferase family 2